MPEGIDMEVLLSVLAAVALLTGQLLLCFKVKSRLIRLLPGLLGVLACIAFFVMMLISEGWEVLGYLLLVLFAACAVGVCALGWLIFAIAHLIKRTKITAQAEKPSALHEDET